VGTDYKINQCPLPIQSIFVAVLLTNQNID